MLRVQTASSSPGQSSHEALCRLSPLILLPISSGTGGGEAHLHPLRRMWHRTCNHRHLYLRFLGTTMSEWILVVGSDKRSCFELIDVLRARNYQAVCSFTLADIEVVLQAAGCRVIIFDLDSVPLDNRMLKQLKRRHTDLDILVLSERSFHPELKDAMANYIYASLNKPVDPDELIYLVKGIFCPSTSSK